MRLHCIGIGGDRLYMLARALRQSGYAVSGSDEHVSATQRSEMEKDGWPVAGESWSVENITTGLDGIITGAHVNPDNPELLKAADLGIKVYSIPEFLYEFARYKTRVVIGGNSARGAIASVILHVLEYHNKEVDHVISGTPEHMIHLTKDNDFILFTGNDLPSSEADITPEFYWYQPNIALLSGIGPEAETEERFRIFVDRIVKGGIAVYNEEDEKLKTIVETSENPIRKHPYGRPEYEAVDGEIILDTPEGPMPLELPDEQALHHLAGAKWICQHMGVDEDDFYEAIATYGT
ncbi:Mur ligase domain-containing protein [Sinomicrobium sp. M5D2P17]